MRNSKYKKHNITIDKKTKRILIGSAAGLVIAGLVFFFAYFHVDTVEVMGSSYYSEEDIKTMVLKGPLAKNSVLAPMLYSKSDTEDIAFVEAIDVSQVNYHTICISVKEIQPVGCIKYLDCYMYFDRQGIITASSAERNMRVPYIEGITVDNVAYGDQVPFPDESILSTSVSLARIFAKNDEIPDHISFDEAGNITLTYGTITAELGPDKYLEDKMTRLIAILPKVSGQTGTLHLENVNDDKKIITFEQASTGTDPNANQNGDQMENVDGEGENTDSENDSGSDSDSGENTDSSYDSSSENTDSTEEDSQQDSSENTDTSSDSSYDSGSNNNSDSSLDSGSDSSYDSSDN